MDKEKSMNTQEKTEKVMNTRTAYIDTARALCMLWIVGYWHIGINHDMFMPWIESITIGTLSVFTFISGYFLGGNLKTKEDIKKFYIKRLKRFYLLFALSCISLYALHIINDNINYISSWPQLIFSLLGIACFIGTPPLTIWYFVMIMFFYLITPLINVVDKLRHKLAIALLIFVCLILLKILNIADDRLILYYPIYIMGLLCHKVKFSDKFSIKIFLIFMLFAAITICVYTIKPESIIMQLLSGLASMFLILEMSKLMTNKFTKYVFSNISYASMCAYLFHRQYFCIVNGLFDSIPWGLIYLFVLPIFLIGCYFVQKIYDCYIIKRIFVKRR